MPLIFIEGDLLDSTETYLCHQTNCVSSRSKHLAKAVFDRFPYADIYSQRNVPSIPGSINIQGGDDKRLIINMMGQFYPGCKYPNSAKDGSATRVKLFQSCLDKMLSLQGSFAFPWRIGCGAAGGDWDVYLKMIEDFSTKSKDVTIYKLPTEIPQPEFKTLF